MKDHYKWRLQNYAMAKPMDRIARTVQASTEDGGIVNFTGQDKVENAICDRIHKKIFHLSEQVPICQGQLQRDFGYLAHTPGPIQVLALMYNCLPGCDTATEELL